MTGYRFIESGYFPLEMNWDHDSGDRIDAIRADNDYVAFESSGTIFVLDANTGDLIWSDDFPLGSEDTLEISNDTLYAAGYQALRAYHLSTGLVVWETALSVGGSPSIVEVNERQIFLLRPGSWRIEVFDLATGDYLWAIPCGARGSADVVYDGDSETLFTLAGTTIQVYDAGGNMAQELGEDGFVDLGLFDSGVLYYYVSSSTVLSGYIKALDVRDFEELWVSPLVPDVNAMSIFQESIFISTDLGVFRLNASNGQLEWEAQVQFTDEFLAAPIITNDDMAFVRTTNSGRILALSVNDGAIIGELNISSISGQDEFDLEWVNGQLVFAAGNLIFSFGSP